MKKFDAVAAQGDVYFRKINKLPKGELVKVEPEMDKVIVTHSETGHHHVMAASTVTMYRPKENFDWDAYLVISADTVLEHLRSHDTHEALLFKKGTYHVRRQREYVPEGFRRVED